MSVPNLTILARPPLVQYNENAMLFAGGYILAIFYKQNNFRLFFSHTSS